MQIRRTSSTTPCFLLLGILSAAFGYEDFETFRQSNQVGYDLERTCLEYPDLLGCDFRNSIENWESEPNDNEARMRSKRETNGKEVTPTEKPKPETSALEKREIFPETEKDKEVALPPVYYSYEENFEPEVEKRFGAYRSRNPETEGYKRGPGFRSWGGKRADNPKGNKFSSWGGKRGGKGSKFSNWGGKRAKFVSWGGKRGDGYKGNKFSNWGGKRSFLDDESEFQEDKRGKFASWGGKRDYDFWEEPEDKRAKFGSWGGKRAYDLFEDPEEKRARFGSWGGKRSYDLFDDVDDEKRAKFGSWGGKRSYDLFDDVDDEKRAKFGSWGGKRNYEYFEEPEDKRARFGSWGGKRDIDDDDIDKRSKFSSWGGKRDLEYPISYDGFEKNELFDDDWEKSKNPRFTEGEEDKRSAFRSWGGKRAIGAFGSKNPFLYIRRGDIRKFLNWGGKRKFSSWGGKRSVQDENDEPAEIEKRQSFNSWGGKRDVGKENPTPFEDLNSNVSEIPSSKNLGNESGNLEAKPTSQIDAEETAEKQMAIYSHINPYYPIINKRSSIKTLLLNDIYNSRGTDFGPRRRSEFFPWGGKRDVNKSQR